MSRTQSQLSDASTYNDDGSYSTHSKGYKSLPDSKQAIMIMERSDNEMLEMVKAIVT